MDLFYRRGAIPESLRMLEAPNMNYVYARFFRDPPPPRTVCGGHAFPMA
jgi:hypothetical protein